MIFHEMYSAYYKAVARIIDAAIAGNSNDKDLQRIVVESAFNESVLTVLPALKCERWQLLHSDMTTPIVHSPNIPVSLIEKRWIKAISLNPRIKLFGYTPDGLDGIEPLFTQDDYYVYDRYSDGDPFFDEGYIERFRTVLEAVKHKLPLSIEVLNKSGKAIFVRCIPQRLEYSEKDDKFRIFVSGCRYASVLNLGKMISCRIYKGEHTVKDEEPKINERTLVLEINDERNALERVMLHFAHFEKQAECLDKRKYLLRIKYDESDEMELVIRILSFGPMVKALEPSSFVDLIKEKLKKQMDCGLR